jgi:hypothetical protein
VFSEGIDEWLADGRVAVTCLKRSLLLIGLGVGKNVVSGAA